MTDAINKSSGAKDQANNTNLAALADDERAEQEEHHRANFRLPFQPTPNNEKIHLEANAAIKRERGNSE